MSRPIAAIIGGTHPFTRAGRGGHETYVIATAEAATRAGYAVHVFALGAKPASESHADWTLHVVQTPMRPIRTMAAVAHTPFTARAIADAIGRLGAGPLIVHAIGAWASLGVAVRDMLRARGRHAVLVASVYTTLRHEVDAKVRAFDPHVHRRRERLTYVWEYAWVALVASYAEARAYRRADLLLTNYRSVDALLAPLHITRPRRSITYASPSAFADEPLPARSVTSVVSIGVVARHDPRKGLDRLIRALALLAADGIPFTATLAGRGPLLDDHRALARDLGIDDRITFPGWVADASSLLRAHDIYVLPSLEEGSGSVAMLEAMQAGCAIVASAIDGIPEDVRDGIDGLLVPPDDPPALRDALAALIRDDALRARLARAARATFERRFSAEAMIADLRAAYAEALTLAAVQIRDTDRPR